MHSAVYRRGYWRLLVLFFFALLAAACTSPSGGEGVGSALEPSTGPTLLSIAVTPSSSTLYAGDTEQLVAIGFYNDGSTQNVTSSATWTSGNGKVASVNAAGLVSAIDHGSSTITAASGKVKGKASLTVSLTMTSIAVTPSSSTLPAHTTEALKATATYDNGTNKNVTSVVTWTSSNPAIATVSASGQLVTWSPGTATIMASSSASSDSLVVGTATIVVDDATVTAVSLTPQNKKIPAGTAQAYTATATFSDGVKQALQPQFVTWSSSNASVATITGGTATSVAPGVTTITATPLGSSMSASAKLTVTSAVLTSLSITPSSSSLATGLTEQLTAMGLYSDGSTMDLTSQVVWTSNSGAATISATGVVTAVSQGSAVLQATSGSISATASVTVGPPVVVSIALTPPALTIPVGETASLDAVATLSDGTTADISSTAVWASSSSDVATVAAGFVSAASPGTATITALDAASGVTQSATVTVTAAVLVSVALTPANPEVIVGGTLQLAATGTYSDGSTADLTASATWASSSDAASVGTSPGTPGLVGALAVGSAVISATDTTTGISGSTTVTVAPNVLVSIVVSPAAATMVNGTAQSFTATGMYANGSSSDLTSQVAWSSSAPGVVAFLGAPANVAMAESAGTAVVSATDAATGIAGNASITVPNAGACYPLPSGAVSWWPGNGNLADAAGTNNASASGAVTYSQGMVGEAMHFSENAYAEASSTNLPIGSSDRTLEAWVQLDTPYVGYQQGLFFGYGQPFQGGGEAVLLTEGRSTPPGELSFSQWGASVHASSSPVIGAWYHVAVTVSSSVTSFYVNGVLVDQETLGYDTPSGTPTFFGGGVYSDVGLMSLNGAVDEATIYSRALSAAEIQGIYLAGSAGKCAPTTGPLTSLTFAQPVNYGPASAFVAADVDQDGDLDLVVANPGAGTVSVLYGDGTGAFGSPVSFSAGVAPTSVAVTDLDNDGILDIVAADYGSSGVLVLLGRGNRSYSAATSFPAPATAPGWIATGDVDGDGNQDVVVSGFNSGGGPSNNFVGVLFGDGTGGFDLAASQGFPGATDGLSGVVVGDIDRDGYADIVYSLDGYFEGGSGAVVLFGSPSRALTRTARSIDGYGVFGLALGDMNNDGFPDVVTADVYANGGGFQIDLNDRAGGIGTSEFVVGAPCGHPAVADWNRDGFLDVFVGGALYEGDGTGLSYAPPISVPMHVDASSTSGPSSAGVDLDGDGRVDLVAISGGDLLVSLSTSD